MESMIKTIVEDYITKDYFKGASILVSIKNKIVYHESFGYSSFTPDKITLAKDTIFDIASVTKIFTSTAILRLATINKLNLNDSLTTHLRFNDSHLNDLLQTITIEGLLTHSSGLIPWFPFYTMLEDDFETVLKHILSNNPLKRGIIQYSDINFILLGKVIECIMKEGLDSALSSLITKPLGLNKTAYIPLSNDIAATEYGNRIETNMVKERDLVFNGFRSTDKAIISEVNDGNCYYYFGGISGHAGLFSNIYDLNTLCGLYINEGKINYETFINESLIKDSYRNYGESRGLGWHKSDLFPGGIGHTGFTGTSIYINLTMNLSVVILTNRLHVSKPVNIADFRSAIHNRIINTPELFND